MNCIIAKTDRNTYRLNLDDYGKDVYTYHITAKEAMASVLLEDYLVFDESINDTEMLSILLGIV